MNVDLTKTDIKAIIKHLEADNDTKQSAIKYIKGRNPKDPLIAKHEAKVIANNKIIDKLEKASS